MIFIIIEEYLMLNIIGHLNINSVHNKFDSPIEIIINFNIFFIISKFKLVKSFPSIQFNINGYKIFRRDHKRFGGDLMFCIDDGILCKVLSSHIT